MTVRREAVAAGGLLVLAAFACVGALLSTSDSAPLFLLFGAAQVAAAVGVALRRGWARTVGVVLTFLWLLGQGLVVIAILGSIVAPASAVGVTPLTLVLTAVFTILAGGTLWLLVRLPSR